MKRNAYGDTIIIIRIEVLGDKVSGMCRVNLFCNLCHRIHRMLVIDGKRIHLFECVFQFKHIRELRIQVRVAFKKIIRINKITEWIQFAITGTVNPAAV